MTECPSCEAVSEKSYRCSECGADLAGRGKSNATRMEDHS